MYVELLVACGAVGASALWNFKMSENKKPVVSFQLDKRDREVIEALAIREKVSLSEWLRARVLSSITPEDRRAIFGQMDPVASALSENGPDLSEGRPLSGVMLPVPRPKADSQAQRFARSGMPFHPCVWLDPLRKSPMAGSCYGTCTQREQDGKACYWAPEVAPKCDVFEGKRRENLVIGQRMVGDREKRLP